MTAANDLASLLDRLRTRVAVSPDQYATVSELLAVVEEMQAMRPQWIVSTSSSCRDNGHGICTSCSTMHTMPSYAIATVAPHNAAEIARLQGERDELDRTCGELIDERDFRVGQIDAIADELGDEGEWSNLHDRGNEARYLARGLVADRDRLAADVKTIAERVERETVEAIVKWLESMHGMVVDAEDADLIRNTADLVRRGLWRTK